MKTKTPDGRSVRPELVVLDDPQTDESARSLSQCATRESILAGAVLGLAGPGKKISGIMPCTVIRPGDMRERVSTALRHDPYLARRNLRFESFEGRIRLSGVVQSYYQKQMAQEVIRRIDGVAQVENELEVVAL